MPTTRPHLTTLRPSPSTVSYTVSSAFPRQTFPSRFLRYVLLLHRILLGLVTLLVLCAKAFESIPSLLAPLSEYLSRVPWVQVGPLASASLFLVFRRFHTGIFFAMIFLASKLPSVSFPAVYHPLISFFSINRRIPPDAPHPRHPN